jgi:tRNA pseudouridine55 synthase
VNDASAASAAPVQQKRALNGVILLDKPAGITSQTAVLKLKRLLAAEKAGHTGTLDPMAQGLLPVCFGEATKFSHLLLDADKTYRASITLGVVTSTGDMEGTVTARAPVSVARSTVEAILPSFVGEGLQTPPMYSAVKHAGKPLYKYARAGLDIVRQARPIHIRRIELDAFSGDQLTVTLTCSKGTYVRVLAEDIGRALGCGACLSGLRRTAIGTFNVGAAVRLDTLQEMTLCAREACLLSVDSLVSALPRIDLDAAQAGKLRTGLAVHDVCATALGLVRVYGPAREYLGIAMIEKPGTMIPRRLMATGSSVAGSVRQAVKLDC